MNIFDKQIGNIHQFSLQGRFDTISAESFENRINELIKENISQFVIDLSEVNYINSAGLRVLITALKNTKQNGNGDVRLVGFQKQVKQVFEISGFTILFEIFSELDEAIKSFS